MHTVEQKVSEIVTNKLADSFEVSMTCETAELTVYELVLSHVLFCWHMPVSEDYGGWVRGGSRIFLRRGAPLRNDVTDGEVKKFKSQNVYTKTKASSQGRRVRTPCTLPLDPPLLSHRLVCSRVATPAVPVKFNPWEAWSAAIAAGKHASLGAECFLEYWMISTAYNAAWCNKLQGSLTYSYPKWRMIIAVNFSI